MKKRIEKSYFIGTSGWSYAHWRDRFYPSKIKSSDWLGYYAGNFNTVEVNMTFYRWPKRNLLKNWHNNSPEDFSFTLKAPRTITHVKKLRNVEKWVKDFYNLADLLQEKLACILFQLPPFLRLNQEKLEGFLENLDKKYRNVIEFRDESWWCRGIYDLLKKYRVAFCIVSTSGLPSSVVVSSNVAYFRFHGLQMYRSNYPAFELKKWADKIKRVASREIYCYFNNDSNAYAVKNALELKKMLKC